jgi:hypothetical protein
MYLLLVVAMHLEKMGCKLPCASNDVAFHPFSGIKYISLVGWTVSGKRHMELHTVVVKALCYKPEFHGFDSQ